MLRALSMTYVTDLEITPTPHLMEIRHSSRISMNIDNIFFTSFCLLEQTHFELSLSIIFSVKSAIFMEKLSFFVIFLRKFSIRKCLKNWYFFLRQFCTLWHFFSQNPHFLIESWKIEKSTFLGKWAFCEKKCHKRHFFESQNPCAATVCAVVTLLYPFLKLF